MDSYIHIFIFMHIGHQTTLALLRARLHDECANVRWAAAQALGNLAIAGEPSTVSALIDRVRDADEALAMFVQVSK